MKPANVPPLVDVTSYDHTLILTGVGESFRVRSRIRFTAVPDSSTFIDAITASVERVRLNDVDLDLAEVVGPARITLPGLAAENELIVDARFYYMNTGEGLHRFVDPIDGEVVPVLAVRGPGRPPCLPRVRAARPQGLRTHVHRASLPTHWTVVSQLPHPAAPSGAKETFAELDEDRRDRAVRVAVRSHHRGSQSYITAIIAGPYSRPCIRS